MCPSLANLTALSSCTATVPSCTCQRVQIVPDALSFAGYCSTTIVQVSLSVSHYMFGRSQLSRPSEHLLVVPVLVSIECCISIVFPGREILS